MNIQKFLVTLMLTLSAISINAQTENPRGIYKLVGINGKDGRYFKEPFDQYKICGDNVTLTMVKNGNTFRIFRNDSKVFNYTGSEPASAEDKSSLIYDSDDKGFKLKWWSDYPNHRIFPSNDWCVETYSTNGFSKSMKEIANGLRSDYVSNKKKDLTGSWRLIGMMDELRGVKKEVQRIMNEYPESKLYNKIFFVFTDKNMAVLDNNIGSFDEIEYIGNKGYKIIKDRFNDDSNEIRNVTWISNDLIAIEVKVDYRTDYQILERMKDGKTILDYIFESYKKFQFITQ